MVFEHLTIFEVHVHPGTEDSVPKHSSEDTAASSTKPVKGASKRRTVIALLAASLVVSVVASVTAKRLASRFSDTESTDSTAEDPEIEIAQ